MTRFKAAWQWWYRTDWAVALTIFAAAALPRLLPQSGQFLDPDAAAFWLPRIKEFLNGLRGLGIEHLAPASHPGVTLLWLSAPIEWIHQTFNPWAHTADPVVSYIRALKVPLALATSGLAVLVWELLRRSINRRLAVIIALGFALDPLYLVFSRYLHLDALITGLTICGLVSFWLGLQRKQDRWLWLSGAVFALATLTRVNGVIGFVFVLLSTTAFIGRDIRLLWRRVVILSAAFMLTIIIAWPPVVLAPKYVLETQNRNLAITLSAHEVPPGVDTIPAVRAGLYPLFILTREFPLFLLFILCGVRVVWRYRLRPEGKLALWLLTFSLITWGLLLLEPKKIDRYILPVIGPLLVFGGFGAVTVWEWLGLRRWSRWWRTGLIVTGLGQLVLFWSLAPYYQSYQNIFQRLLAQTSFRTSEVMEPAWGEGVSEATAHLRATHQTFPSLASWFAGIVCAYGQPRTVEFYPLSPRPQLLCPPGLRLLAVPSQAEYLLLSRDQIAQRIYPRLLDDIKRLGWQPEYVAVINGQPMVYLYRNLGGLAAEYTLTGK